MVLEVVPLTSRPVEPVARATDVTLPTPPAATQDVLVPSVDSTLPLLAACEGARALNAAVAVVWPVPPLAMGSVPLMCVVAPESAILP